jgi:hypothetical protein
MSRDCCCAVASVRPFWRGRRMLRLAACASVVFVGSACTSVLVATAMAEDLPPPPARSAQTDLDGTSAAPIASPESTTTTEVTSDAVETPVTTADGFETSTDISATASDTTVTASSSTDTSSTDTSTTATEAAAGTTSEGTDAATDTAPSSCTMDGAAIAPDAAGTVDNTTDGTDAAGDTAGTTVTTVDTTDSTQTCVEEQASANTAERDNAAAPSDAAPADTTTDAPASTPTTRADGDRGLQSHAGPVATSADGDSSSAEARTASLAPEIATVSPTGDAQSTTDLAGEVTPSDDAATAVAVGQTLDVGSWTGSFGADQWQLESRFSGCLSALSAEGCAFSHVFVVGQRGGGLLTAHVRERSPTEAKGRSARAQRPESPRRRAPERRLPVPTMPSGSVGSGASEGSHGGAVLGLISADLGLLALAGIRALAHLERRPPTPPLISRLERPG